MLDDDGKTKWGWSAELACDGERERKKRMAGEWEETRHCYGTYRETAQAKCIKGYENTNTLPTCNRQWKLTVNSQKQSGNDTATVPHAGRLHRNKKNKISQPPRAQSFTSPAAHKKQGQWPVMSESKLPWGQTETRHTARTAGSAHRGEPTDMCRLHDDLFFFSHSAGGKSFKKKKNGTTLSALQIHSH